MAPISGNLFVLKWPKVTILAAIVISLRRMWLTLDKNDYRSAGRGLLGLGGDFSFFVEATETIEPRHEHLKQPILDTILSSTSRSHKNHGNRGFREMTHFPKNGGLPENSDEMFSKNSAANH